LARHKGNLADVLTRDNLLALAGGRSFSRGEDYYRSGQVGEIVTHEGVISARVVGSEVYQSKLWAEGDGLEYDCTCPAADEFGFCKHCVALGLKWLTLQADSPQAHPDPLERIRAYLSSRDSADLIKIIVDRAFEDESFRERLLRKVELASSSGFNPAYYRKLIKSATFVRGYVDYDEVPEFVEGLEEMAGELAALIDEGYASEAVELIEAAIDAVEESLESVDDSDGDVGGMLERLGDIHLDACLAARPDPVALARRLFERELNGTYETFLGAASAYSDALGEPGLAEYRRLIEAEWKRLPALAPGDERSWGGNRFRVTHMMEGMARATGDVDTLIAIKRKDLSTARAFLDIAQELRQAGRDEEAVRWAQDGIEAFGVGADGRLVQFLASTLEQTGQTDRMLDLLADYVRANPTAASYGMLRTAAEAVGAWAGRRQAAREALKAAGSRYGGSSELVEALLAEGDVDAAWSAAVEGGCNDSLWVRLADARAESHPEDALTVYEARLGDALEPASQDAYQTVVRLLGRMQPVMERLGRERQFQDRVSSIRQEYKRRRNLLQLMDSAGFRERRAA
jgi:uncharacterized Zn finger protein